MKVDLAVLWISFCSGRAGFLLTSSSGGAVELLHDIRSSFS
jgi:hypothetical protein